MPKRSFGHPSRISNRQKLIRSRDHDNILGQRKVQHPLETIDLTKSDWSNRRGAKRKDKV